MSAASARRRPPRAPSAPAPIDAAQVSEQPTQVAFTAPYKVTVAAGQSLMLPLLDRELPARRIDLFQPSVNARHPLAAIEMTNDSGSGLPPGVLTLYQQNPDSGALYLGDARLAALAGRRQAAVELCPRRQGHDRPRHRRAAADRQGVGRRRGHADRPGAALDDDVPGEIGRPAAPGRC